MCVNEQFAESTHLRAVGERLHCIPVVVSRVGLVQLVPHPGLPLGLRLLGRAAKRCSCRWSGSGLLGLGRRPRRGGRDECWARHAGWRGWLALLLL
jgi:hypothetical protein